MIRSRAAFATLGAIAAMVVPGAAGVSPMLVWNASASVAVGLYRVSPIRALHIGDIAVVTPPEPLAIDLAERGALPMGVLLLKPIAALEGQTVCRHGRRVLIDRMVVGAARHRDSRGHPLPVWEGCRTLGPADVFLMNSAEPDSFDGRYFGTLPVSSVIGRATPIWIPKEH